MRKEVDNRDSENNRPDNEDESFSSYSSSHDTDEDEDEAPSSAEWPPKPQYDQATRELFEDISRGSTRVLEEQPSLLHIADSVTGKTPLHVAAEAGCMPVVNKALSLMAEEEKKNLMKTKDSEGFTALHRAVYGDKLEIVQLLVDAGSDVSYPCDNEIYTAYRPLHFAAFVSNPIVVSFLLSRGAQVNSLADGVRLPSSNHLVIS